MIDVSRQSEGVEQPDGRRHVAAHGRVSPVWGGQTEPTKPE
jgi:hypothetical protein